LLLLLFVTRASRIVLRTCGDTEVEKP